MKSMHYGRLHMLYYDAIDYKQPAMRQEWHASYITTSAHRFGWSSTCLLEQCIWSSADLDVGVQISRVSNTTWESCLYHRLCHRAHMTSRWERAPAHGGVRITCEGGANISHEARKAGCLAAERIFVSTWLGSCCCWSFLPFCGNFEKDLANLFKTVEGGSCNSLSARRCQKKPETVRWLDHNRKWQTCSNTCSKATWTKAAATFLLHCFFLYY